MVRLISRIRKTSYADKRKRVKRQFVRGYRGWQDPFGHLQGTEPEKMVYAELVKRQIPFYFQTEVDFNLPEIGVFKKYRPDFVLFQDKVIIEVQGAYWHSRSETQEADAYKFAVYSTLGYEVVVWWDYEIMTKLAQLIAETPVFRKYAYTGLGRNSEVITARKRSIDDSKGIKTLNYLRAQRLLYKKNAVNIKRGINAKGRRSII